MDPAQNSGDGSGKSREVVEDLPFQEIRCLMAENEPASQNGSSFTALLGLPANQAMELLHEHEAGHPQAEIWRVRGKGQNPLDGFPFDCFPTFPSNPELVERAARFSVFAAEDSSPQTTSSGRSNSGVYLAKAVKTEPAESDSNPNSSAGSKPQQPRPPKRKELEKSKAKGSAKRAKSSVESGVPKPAEGNNGGEKEKLPYVHVRARRGQATDSHSLAERARREKINARMKLLQELVPGCNKISGTAQVLEEIINHVQSLQRQVEFLSMRLAAVNPRIDFSGLDSFLAASGRIQEANAGSAPGLVEQPSMWSDAHRQQQIWLADLVPTPHSYSSSPPPLWGRDDAEQHQGLVPPGSSLFGYDSINPVALHGNQLKQEI